MEKSKAKIFVEKYPGLNLSQTFIKKVFFRVRRHIRSVLIPQFRHLHTDVYYGWRAHQSKTRMRKIKKTLKYLSRAAVPALVLLSIIIYTVRQDTPYALGATYTFNQTSWSGGVSGNTASHPGDETGWNKFSTSTNAFTTGTTTVSIASTTYTFTDDGTPSTSGFGSGGGWYSGATSSALVSGSGTNASVSLAIQSSGETHTMTRLADSSIGDGGNTNNPLLRDGSSDYIYQANAGGFARYSISGNSWTTLTSPPAAFSGGVTLVMQASSNTIYAVRGGGTNSFYRYSIGGNSWTTLSTIPGTVVNSYSSSPLAVMSQDGNSIYVIGGDGSTAFYRYSVTSSSWTTLSSIPASLRNYNAHIFWNGSEPYIYVTRGSTGSVSTPAELYRYTIASNSWTSLQSEPSGAGTGDVVRAPNGGNIFVMNVGPSNHEMYKYDMVTSSWIYLRDDIPGSSGGLAILNDSSSDSVYYDSDYNGNSMMKYTISNNSITAYSRPAACGSDHIISIIRNGTDNYMYFLAYQSGGSTRFCVDQINTITYAASGNFTSASMDLGAAQMKSISWTSTTPSGVGASAIKFQLAANNDNSTWSYVGPDGTNGTYFTTNGGTSFPSSLLNKRYWRYKAFLTTSDTSVSPSLNNVTFTYTSYASVQSVTVTDDTSLSTTGSASGGGFGGGSNASTLVSGGSVRLDSTLVNEAHRITQLADAPRYAGATWNWNGSDDYIYMLADYMWRYSISGNSWSQMAQIPGASGSAGGVGMLRNNNEDFIYALTGNTNVNYFSKYSITNDAWTRLADVPGSGAPYPWMVRYGAEDYIYVAPDPATTTFYRYSIAGNSWTTLAPMPSPINLYHKYQTLLRTAGDDYIFFSDSQGAAFRYSISNNSWITLTSTGNQLIRNGADDEIYSIVGSASSKPLQRYSVLNNSFTDLASTPSGMNDWAGTVLMRNGNSDYIYGISLVTTSFYRYTIAGNSWAQITSTLPFSPGIEDDKPLMSADGNTMYIMARNNAGLVRDEINTNQYYSSGTFTSASIDLGGVSSLTRIAWTSTTPSGVGSGAIRFQIAMNNDNATWSYVGPDGTSGTYFSTNGGTTFSGAQSGYRYMRYRLYLATSDTSVSPSLDSVTFTYNAYSAAANLTSNIYDSLDPTNILASLAWSPYLPSGSAVQFQLRGGTSTTTLNAATWVGPDGTNSTYFTVYTGENTSSTMRTGSGYRYFQYKVFLSSSNFALTPILSSVTVTYVVNAPPEIRNVSATPNNDGTITISYEVRDIDTLTGSVTPGYITPSFQYCPGGASCQSIVSLAAGSTANKAVDGTNWTTYTATWIPKAELPNLYVTNAEIKVTANDNEAANNSASAFSSTFILDTASPSAANFYIDASQSPAVLHFAATDTSSIRYRIAPTSAGIAGASFSNFVTTTTYTTTTNPFTLYTQYADAYGNTTTIISATTPEQPSAMMVQDTSNVNITPAEVRLFVAWKAVGGSFASYKVYRSLDQSNWTLVGTVNDVSTNYFGDSTVSQGTVYYYRVNTIDTNGNISYNSITISASPNGVQDQGEGGGGTAAAPVISNVTTTVGVNDATITWDTNTLSDSAVGYSTTPADFSTTSTVSSMVNNSSGVGRHSVTLSGLSASTTYYFNVRSTDVGGQTSTSNNGGNGYSFTTKNGVTISHVAVSQVYNTSATVTWDTTASADSYVVYSANSNLSSPATVGSVAPATNHAVALTGLSAGTTYYFYVQSTDGNGVLSEDKHIVNGVTTYYTFGTTNDVAGPVISGVTSTGYSNYARVGWTTGEVADSLIEYGTSTSYGESTVLDTTLTIQHQVTVSSLSSATLYHYRIHTKDANGNETISLDQTVMTAIHPDSDAPIISGVTTSSVSLLGAVIRWTTDENANATVDYGTTVSYGYLAGDAEHFTTTSHAVTLGGLSGNTTYYFRVRSQDSSGNTTVDDNSGSSYVFTTAADVTPPIISNVSTTLTNESGAAISWSTNEDANAQLEYGLVPGAFNTVVTSSGYMSLDHLVVVNYLQPATTYYYRVVSADPSSNSAVSDNGGSGYSFTTAQPGGIVVIQQGGGGGNVPMAALTDTSPPVISNIQFPNTTKDSTTVTWITNENCAPFVRYGETTSYGEMSGSYSTFVSSHSITLQNLLPGTAYHAIVACLDKAGNYAESADQQFVTLNVDNTQVTKLPTETTPTLTQEEADQKRLLANIAKASQDTIQKILISLSQNPELSGISEDVFVKAINEMASRAVEAPSIVGPQPQVTVDGTTAIVRWSTNKNANGTVLFAKKSEYNPSGSHPYTDAATAPDEMTTVHTVTITNLDPGTEYHYQVISKGTIGPESRSADRTFTTTANPPKISDINISNTSQSSVSFGWKTNVPAAATIEYQNTETAEKLTQGDTSLLVNHLITINNLKPGTKYTAVIKAVDEKGGQASSDVLQFTTVLDTAAPIISKVTAESSLFPGSNARVQTIISFETNELAVSQVFYKEGTGAGGTVVSTTPDLSPTTKHVDVLTAFKPGTVYTYWIVSKDLAGNETATDKFTILTPQQKETIIDVMIKNFDQVFGWTKQISF